MVARCGRLDEELSAHLEMQTLREMRKGLPREEAEQAARRVFGNATLVSEACREQRGIRWLGTSCRDVTYGARQLWKDRGSPQLRCLRWHLESEPIAPSSAQWKACCCGPFPYQEQDRLVTLYCAVPSKGIPQMGFAIPDLRDLTSRSHSFSSIAGYFWGDANLADGAPEHVQDIHAGREAVLAAGRTRRHGTYVCR